MKVSLALMAIATLTACGIPFIPFI